MSECHECGYYRDPVEEGVATDNAQQLNHLADAIAEGDNLTALRLLNELFSEYVLNRCAARGRKTFMSARDLLS